MSELIKRVLVAVIGIPVAILIVYEGFYAFLVAILLLSTIALVEFYNIAGKKDSYPNYTLSITFNIVFLLMIGMYDHFQEIVDTDLFGLGIFILYFFLFYVLILLSLEIFRSKRNPISSVSFSLTGNIYITLSFATFIIIRKLHELKFLLRESTIESIEMESSAFINISDEFCMWLFLIVLFSVWISDSAAYFIGRSYGKHKLAPRVSPKKTWEGSIAGFIGGLISFFAFSWFLLPELQIIHSIIIGIIIGSIGQLGDLSESQIKRDAGVKDSSTLIPGHGGVLDRFDSLLFIMPAISLYLFLLLS